MGKTHKEDKEHHQKMTGFHKQLGGDDFSAKLKSTRRNAFRDFRKEMGPSSASLRRNAKQKALEAKKK